MPLEQLLGQFSKQTARKGIVSADFHNHLHTGGKLRSTEKPKTLWERIRGAFLEEGFSSLSGVFDRMMSTGLDVLYLTNTNEESRYEEWTSKEQIAIARKAGYEVEVGEYFVFAKKGNRVIALGKSQEVFTQNGHFLFAGIRRGKKFPVKQSLEATLSAATDGELKIADHPYARVKGQHGVLAYSKNPEEDAKKCDALERNGNFHLPFFLANLKAKIYSRLYHKSLLANSDGHHPRDIGRTYNLFDAKKLDYSSERAFRDSINNAVRESNFSSHYMPTPIWRIFHHVLMMYLNGSRINSYKEIKSTQEK